MRYIIFALVLCVMGCAAMEGVEGSIVAHQEELCYVETIGLDEHDSFLQFDACMTRGQ